MTYEERQVLNRWRLILGKYSDDSFSNNIQMTDTLNDSTYNEIDDVLDFLYGREYGADRGMREESGGDGESILNIPTWIDKIRNIFPSETVERLEAHALDRYGLLELITDKSVLEKLEPNMTLLKNILAVKGMMKGEVLDTAKKIIAQVVKDIEKELENEVKQVFSGRVNKNLSVPFKCSKNFDFKRTIHYNLKNYDKKRKKITVEKIYFNRNVQRYNPWNIIICIDESGSMTESIIYSAIIAGIFSKLPIMSVKLVIFDTSIVDLTGYVDDPVEILMSVTLGGGTDITRALTYCETLISEPSKTIVVLISDLYENGDVANLYAITQSIVGSGAKLLALTAMSPESSSNYNKTVAKNMASLGANVAAVTPKSLAQWIKEIIN